MDAQDVLVRGFEERRAHLWSVAYRMLGTRTDADDAVQEAWLRVSRAGADGVQNLGGWLTTVVARVCLDTLRARQSRREEPVGASIPEPLVEHAGTIDPERDRLLADAMAPALVVILDTLGPAERVAYVLHDIFGIPFEEVGPMIGRSAAAARQLGSRARRRIQGADKSAEAEREHQRELVDAFLTASREGNFDALLAVLDPDVVVRADGAAIQLAVQSGDPTEFRSAAEVAKWFAGRARGAQRAVVDGFPGLVWAPGKKPKVAFWFHVSGGKISGIELLADPETLAQLQLELLER